MNLKKVLKKKKKYEDKLQKSGAYQEGYLTVLLSNAMIAKSWNKYMDEFWKAKDQKKRNEDESIPVEFEVEETE